MATIGDGNLHNQKKNLKLVATLEQMVKNQQAKQAKEIANKQRTIAKPKQIEIKIDIQN
jgi:hypothetical protein